MSDPRILDLAVVGAGAAGLAAAIFAARKTPGLAVAALDGAAKIGAKILVSGGGRCNVTNTVVAAEDFWGGSRNVVRRVLSAFPAEKAVEFFGELGVALHEEPGGKLFPDSNRARTVLDALLREARARGVEILTGRRVTAIRKDDHFELETSSGPARARRVVLATGGRSLPKTGSDGLGYEFARSLGHTIVPATPALAPLVLDGDFHAALSGVSQEAEIAIRAEGERPVRLRGALLWTHFGASGPVAMNASRHWHRARLEGRAVSLTASLLPDDDFESADRKLREIPSRLLVHNALAALLPARVAEAVARNLGIAADVRAAHLPREERRKLARALLEWPLPVRDSRGWNYAEVTAGGVPLDEVDPSTMESRKCPGLYLVGEILDVDGRIGGFNFQWAWSTGWMAGTHAAARIPCPPVPRDL